MLRVVEWPAEVEEEELELWTVEDGAEVRAVVGEDETGGVDTCETVCVTVELVDASPEIVNGFEYWKVAVSLSSSSLMPKTAYDVRVVGTFQLYEPSVELMPPETCQQS